MLYVLVGLITFLIVFIAIKAEKSKGKTTAIILLIVVLVGAIVIPGYVGWHDPYKAIEKEMEKKIGKDLFIVDKGSQGSDSFQAFRQRKIFWAELKVTGEGTEYKCYASRRNKVIGYSFTSNYNDIKYNDQLTSEFVEIGRECFGEGITVHYNTGCYLPLDKDYTYEEYLDEVESFSLSVYVNSISDYTAIEGGKKYLEALEGRGIKTSLYEVKRSQGDVLFQKGYDIDDTKTKKYKPISQSIRDEYEVYKKNEKLGYIITINNGKKGVIDYSGNVLADCLYDDVHLADNTFLWLKTGNYKDEQGSQIRGFIYLPTMSVSLDDYSYIYDEEEYLLIQKDDTEGDLKWVYGAVDLYCNEIIPCIYADIETDLDRIKATKKDGSVEYFDFSGNKLW